MRRCRHAFLAAVGAVAILVANAAVLAPAALAQNGSTSGPAAGTNVTPNTASGATDMKRKTPGGQDGSPTTGSVGVGVPADKAKPDTEGGPAQKPPGGSAQTQ